jgi:transcriptional regulator, XRE family
MKMSYNKLWKLLIDKQMKKSDLRKKAGISSSSLAKLTKDENVTTEVLSKICQELKCDVADIMEFVPDPNPETPTRIREGEKEPSD